MSEQAKRKPDWTLCVKEGEKWRAIGAAWTTEKGNMFVRLDDGERLEGTAMFFPFQERPAGWYSRWKGKGSAPQRPPQAASDDYMERKRRERFVPPAPPRHPLPPLDNGPDLDIEPPPWLE